MVADRIAQDIAGGLVGDGVVGVDGGAGVGEFLCDGQGGGFADVVGAGFEGQAPHGKGLAGELVLAAEVLDDLVVEGHALLLVDVVDGLEQGGGGFGFQTHADAGEGVLGEAGPAVAQAGVEEFIADAGVAGHAAPDLVDVAAVGLAEVGDLVDEGDLGGEHGIGGVLDHLRGGNVHDVDGVAVADEGLVELAHPAAGALVGDADHDAVGFVEVVDRGAFFEELGVRGHVEGFVGFGFDGFADFFVGADRDGGLDHDDLAAAFVQLAAGVAGRVLDRLADVARRGEDVLEVGVAHLIAGRAHADEDHLGVGVGLGLVGGEVQAAGLVVALDQLVEARLVDRADAVLELLDLLGVHVEAGHLVADVRKAGAGDESDVAGADHGDTHRSLFLKRPG